jgi:hypothetical protein
MSEFGGKGEYDNSGESNLSDSGTLPAPRLLRVAPHEGGKKTLVVVQPKEEETPNEVVLDIPYESFLLAAPSGLAKPVQGSERTRQKEG